MNANELKKLLTSAQNEIQKTKLNFFASNEQEMSEPDDSARAALDALKTYLQKSDDLMAWINQNTPVSFEILASPRPLVEDTEPLPQKDYGNFTQENALKLLEDYGKLSTSLLQRKFFVGYARAAKMLDALAQKGYIQHTPDGWIKI